MGKKKHQACSQFTSLLVSAASTGSGGSKFLHQFHMFSNPFPGNSGFVLDLFILDAQPLGG